MTFHETECSRENEINDIYPSFTCLGFVQPPDDDDDDGLVTGHHYILDLVSGAWIDTDEQAENSEAS